MSTLPLTSSYSSSFCYAFTYDVFISFRGSDTRYGFTNNLYNALDRKGIRTFFDDEELRKGEEITESLVKAIEESRIAIVVFSKNYASSSFCLDELVKIMECVKGNGRLVFPVFYDVDPCDVRHQKGSYAVALTKHEERFKDDMKKLQKWRTALHEAANLSGNDFKLQREYEHAFIEKIVKEISNRIGRTPLHVADYPIGLESRVQEVNKLLNGGSNSGALMVGIYGVGGIGKTTLAKEVYNLTADPFHGLCFLENVRENSNKNGLAYLQELFLSKTLGEKDIKLASVSEGISLIKQRLKSKKVLLVLDDVEKLEQLQAIAGRPDWFGPGSIIIITTRDKHLLASHMVERTYQVKKFDEKEALELLRWNAFKYENVDPSYMHMLSKVVSYASGLPLALVVIGSNLYGRSVEEWISALHEYKRIPNKDIQKKLKVSFDALEEYHQKLFLDIACCFKGYSFDDLENVLHAFYDVSPILGIRVLAERSLINIDKDGHVTQHDLIQDMGREIVRQESPKNPGKRSRSWLPEDIIRVLQENIGTNEIELIILQAPTSELIEWDGEAFKKMENLKTLIILSGNFSRSPNYLPNSLRLLEWREYPSYSLPVDFHPKKLAILKLPKNCLTLLRLVKVLKEFVEMSVLDFSWNDWIKHIPDVSGAPNLKELNFACCGNLINVDKSVGYLSKLRSLDFQGCIKLRNLPSLMLPSLRKLTLVNCSSLVSFPEILGKMEKITYLDLYSTSIRELPYSICNLTRLQEFDLRDGGTVLLPSSIFMFGELLELKFHGYKSLLLSNEGGVEQMPSVSASSTTKRIDLSSCNMSDTFLQIFISQFSNVQELNLSESHFTILPECIKDCHLLRILYLTSCKNLQEIRGIPPNIEILNATDNTSLNCSSREALSDKKLHEEGRKRRFILPGTRIPSWFEHQRSGESVSFWFRNKFPAISLCFLFTEALEFDDQCSLFPHLKLVTHDSDNGGCIFSDQNQSCPRATRSHMRIYDLEDDEGQQFQQNEWNQAVVSLSVEDKSGERELRPEEWGSIEIGVHIIKERSSMDDIQFTLPLLDKDHHKALHMKDSHKHHMQQQQTSLPLLQPVDNLNWDPRSYIVRRLYIRPNRSKLTLWSPVTDVSLCITQTQDHMPSSKKAPGESSRTSCRGDTLNIHGSSPLSLSGKASEEDVPSISSCTASSTSTDKYLGDENVISDDDDVEMNAFYASLDVSGIPMLPCSRDKLVTTTVSKDKEAREALRSVQHVISHDASVLLHPELCSILKANLDHLCKLSADHGRISREASKVISEASRVLTHWSRDYSEASVKIDSIMSHLQKADELEMSLESNKKRFLEVGQLNVDKAMSVSQIEAGMFRKRKREIFEEGKTVKTQLDELKKNLPQWEHEHTLAKKTQATIIAEWSRLRENFQNIEKDWNF
ncbi:hypothetical protein HN51_008263 [Arachis hypogaea]|uniref:TMV resistance protein N isoform X1 n=1 Tax=Arachis hypogaea TaxID=3818 RepID=UPI000DEC9A8D|nr:TMV resistance protein N [Arachis hypogaea]QHO42558.1 TMV resistance protein N [Arachis hypogaea]